MGVAMAQTRLTRGRAAAIRAATAAGATTTAISTAATTTTITPTTTKKRKTICAAPPPLTTTATTAAAAPNSRPLRSSRRLASAPAKPAAPPTHVPVNLGSEDSEYEKEESRKKTPVPTTSEVHETFPHLREMFLDPESGAGVEVRLLHWEMFSQAAGRQKLLRAAENKKRGEKRSLPIPGPKVQSDDESDVDTNPRYPRRRPTKRQKMATGPPAGTAARLHYLMENQEWPVRVNGDKVRTTTGTVYMRRESPPTASLPNSLLSPLKTPLPVLEPPQRPPSPKTPRYLGNGAVEDYKMFSRDQHPEGGRLTRVWRLRKEGGVPNGLADVPCQGEKRKRPSVDDEGEGTGDNAELTSRRGGREKRRRVCSAGWGVGSGMAGELQRATRR
ncbi:hypothetical protein AOL_s00188g298 [Orbilia oligospora ATCC 24927]|uniref:Uncharacterized protein n=1 Tax=Arthrobotrys oligospora (strain ATCC 24927 / CBS 115.81 / DSM 1491) TaxID=756982 RepID=G1XQT6_ARTOA|nr:hypothetical protein AOL_s00188g298 [Orbilia oligospora ATCC 24927]EGX44630.1 hypothetical protein AOL_s00188g298 [Orbilia oligospora ATCC 24927]